MDRSTLEAMRRRLDDAELDLPPQAGSAEQVNARDTAVLAILAKPVDERMAKFSAICIAYRAALQSQFPAGSRNLINQHCRSFARDLLGRLQAIEASNGGEEGSA